MGDDAANHSATYAKAMKTFEQSLQEAIESHIQEVAEEELKLVMTRIRARLMADCVQLAPQVLKHLSPLGSGEIQIRFKGG